MMTRPRSTPLLRRSSCNWPWPSSTNTTASRGLPELAIGIAIHTGEAVVGTVGSHRRLKYTAVGPNVNVVGRIESYARGGQVLISDSTYQLVEDLVTVAGTFRMKSKDADDALPLHVVRGLSAPYWLELPQSSEPMYDAADVAATIARVVDDRIGHDAACRLVALGRESARIRTSMMLAPLDDVVLRIGAIELYGKVSESAVTDNGEGLLTVVYNTVAGDSLDHLVRSPPRTATDPLGRRLDRRSGEAIETDGIGDREPATGAGDRTRTLRTP